MPQEEAIHLHTPDVEPEAGSQGGWDVLTKRTTEPAIGAVAVWLLHTAPEAWADLVARARRACIQTGALDVFNL